MKFRLFMWLGLLALTMQGCRKEEEMRYAGIYFPLAAWAPEDGFFIADFDFTEDTTFVIGAYCGGSVPVPQEVRVSIGLAVDSLSRLQACRPALSDYRLLPERCYDITPADTVAVIPSHGSRGDLKVVFHLEELDADGKYVLPLRIKSASHYEVAPNHSYLFFGINQR